MHVKAITRTLCAIAAIGLGAAAVSADTVVFKNGDKLTGTIKTMDGGKLTITSAVAGEVMVDLKDVATFSTDAPIEIRTADGQKTHVQVSSGDADTVKTADGQAIALGSITRINPPAQKWTGAIIANGSIVRGNTSTENLGVAIDAILRRQDNGIDDRTILGGDYNFGRQRGPTGAKVTTTDDWSANAKYDKFLNEKLYVYGNLAVDHDRIAGLNYRVAPGVGGGYQLIERTDLNIFGEAGFSYVYEDYIVGGKDDHVALRLAYHVDKQLTDTMSIFHNMEYMPALEDPGDYNMTTDAGIRADLTKTFFTEFKAEWKRDSTPAAGAQKNDLRYILGVGWRF